MGRTEKYTQDDARSRRTNFTVHTGLQNQSHGTGRIVRYGTGEVSDGIV